MNWRGKSVLVTGGCSFIGSHLVDALVERGAQVRIVDDLSSGKLENVSRHLTGEIVEFIQADLREPEVAWDAIHGIELVFHLAAIHGGRGYVDLHQAGPAMNLLIGGLVFREACLARVDKIIFASSGCVYPDFLQGDPNEEIYLTEDLVKPPYDADNMYGWAKLMNELTLKAYCEEYGMKGVSCRLFTVYGRRGVENHAVAAFIARAFVGQDPFEIWGDGTQVRNWTHVSDIVRGMILAAEGIDDGSAVNLGTTERITVRSAVEEVLRYTGHKAKLKFLPDMPVGPINRVADNLLAKESLGWEPEVRFIDGLHDTIDWYFGVKEREQVRVILESGKLVGR